MVPIRNCPNCGHVMIEGYDWQKYERCYRCIQCGRVEYDLVPTYYVPSDKIPVSYEKDK